MTLSRVVVGATRRAPDVRSPTVPGWDGTTPQPTGAPRDPRPRCRPSSGEDGRRRPVLSGGPRATEGSPAAAPGGTTRRTSCAAGPAGRHTRAMEPPAADLRDALDEAGR